MDRRTILALILVVAVIFVTPRLFPGRPRVPKLTQDSITAVQQQEKTLASPGTRLASPVQSESAQGTPAASAQLGRAKLGGDTVTVQDVIATYRFVSVGGVLQDANLTSYRSLRPADGSVRLRSPVSPLIRFQAVSGRDTLRFDEVPFSSPSESVRRAGENVEFSGVIGTDSLALTYRVVPDSFLVRVTGRATGRLTGEAGGYILLRFPPTLESNEADTVDDQRHLAFAVMPSHKDARGIAFGKLDPGERTIIPGPQAWAALKSKYFLVAALAQDTASPIVEFSAAGLPRTSRVATSAQGTVLLRAPAGQFSLDLYVGPQQWRRLHSLGRGLENSNPYGGFLQPVVQPFATVVLRVLLWMHEKLNMSYGWVLVVFGVAVRLVLWPLNQTAMRSSLKMQRIQPELNDIQKRYKNDPPKLQSEMMRVYKEHGMSPFSMFSGCLPLLLPMPVLFALFFVFQNTIEFRGVSFLWLRDISQKDPVYLLPIAMGLSMYVLTWIGSRNTPPNPQTKMMGYVFPFMMTFLLANLAAGLNLYYAVQNIAALPQQWLIANERARAAKGPSGAKK
jgi:YidC/Oxa1 family membrane protein insertase